MSDVFFIPPEYYGLNALGDFGRSVSKTIEDVETAKRVKFETEFQKWQLARSMGMDPEEATRAWHENPVLRKEIPNFTVRPGEIDVARERARLSLGTLGQIEPGSRMARALEGLPLETEAEINDSIIRATETQIEELASRRLDVFSRAIQANPAGAPQIYQSLHEDLKKRLPGYNLTVEQLQQVELGSLRPDSPEFKTIVWGDPNGIAGIKDSAVLRTKMEELGLKVEQARLDNILESTRAQRLQIEQLQAEIEAGPQLLGAEHAVNQLTNKGVPVITANKVIRGEELSDEEQAVVQTAYASMLPKNDVGGIWTHLKTMKDLGVANPFTSEQAASLQAATINEALGYEAARVVPVTNRRGILPDKRSFALTYKFNGEDEVKFQAYDLAIDNGIDPVVVSESLEQGIPASEIVGLIQETVAEASNSPATPGSPATTGPVAPGSPANEPIRPGEPAADAPVLDLNTPDVRPLTRELRTELRRERAELRRERAELQRKHDIGVVGAGTVGGQRYMGRSTPARERLNTEREKARVRITEINARLEEVEKRLR